MKEILLTSSVLILAVFLVRWLFRSVISRRVQYALWGLVLLRLLIPFQLPAMEHNVLTAAAPVQQAISHNIAEQTVFVPVERVSIEEFRMQSDEIQPQTTVVGQRVWFTEEETATQYRKLTGEELLTALWLAGMAVMALWFLYSNYRFGSKLRKARAPYSVEGCKYPVYLVEEGLPSPCLFGLFRPAIYLTPAAIRDEETLRHVLAHETTHARHWDPLWSFLRGVCLVVYWFDPLVWAAAFASRTDCELACDEGALKALGEAERIPYGKTLLSLIPVRKSPASPLLSATTMTADKKRLTERIRRIAENRQTVHAALFAVIAIAVMVCALTFTAAKEEETPIVPLTSEEITWFNTEFFNAGDMKNQFLSSDYESPEAINMYELFYNGAAVPAERSAGTTISDQERKLLLSTYFDSEDPGVDCEKIPSADIDVVLLENMGLSLADTQALSMGAFQYLSKYGAYYHYHGDTNARPQVEILSGERQGDEVRLYYYDEFTNGWKCVTLIYRAEGGLYQASFDSATGKKRISLVETVPAYHFVSNLPCEAPSGASHSTVTLPEGKPDARVKLDNLTPIGPQKVSVTEADGAAVRAALGSNTSQVTIGNTSVVCWSDSGNYHFSYGRTDGNIGEATFYDLLVCPKVGNPQEDYSVERFYNLLGHNGFVVSYWGDKDFEPRANGNFVVKRYYALEDGEPQLLASTLGFQDIRTDLDGDGINELYCGGYFSQELRLFFSRDNAIYGLNLEAKAQEAYPHWDYVNLGACENGRINVSGSYQREDGCYVQAFRYLYFTGDELLFYKDSRETRDHVMGEPDVSEEVLEMAKDEVSAYYTRKSTAEAQYDNWRIENLELAQTYSFTGGDLEVYNLNFEFHAGNPQGVGLAGGMYHTEDDWVMPSYPNCFYLYFVNENGVRRYLKMEMINDGTPGVEWFDWDVYNMAIAEGLASSMADLDGKVLLKNLSSNTVSFLDAMSQLSLEEQKTIASKICYYRTSGDQEDQDFYTETMQTLVTWNTYGLTTAQYDAWSLLFNYHVCQPAELTTQEQYAALDAASTHMWKRSENEACLSFDLLDVSIDSYETWRVVNMYTDSESAVRNGYDHETMTHLTAVRAVYNVSWDHSKVFYDEEGLWSMYLYMLPDENGNWFLWDSMVADVPEFYELAVESLTTGSKVILQMNNSGFMTEMTDYWRLRVESYPTDLTWTAVEAEKEPAGNSLTLGNTEMGIYIRCWEESDLVQVNFMDQITWYQTVPLYADASFDGRLFSMMRQWYDSVAWNGLLNEIVILNRGQSQLEVAQEWAERYVEIHTKMAPGSQYACTYARVEEVSLWDWVPESAYPADSTGKERFCFGFSCVFVPETEKALQYLIAGNTVEYDGEPQGAYTYGRVGYMYLDTGGWRCDGVGTGI